jgi:hypothetical protein
MLKLKHFALFLTGASMGGVTFIQIVAPAGRIGWWRWRGPLLACLLVTSASFAILAWRSYADDKEYREERARKDTKFEEMALAFSNRGKLSSGAPSYPLRDKVIDLGQELFSFLREKGPKPEPEIEKSKSIAENIENIMTMRGPYAEAIHYGYLHKFKQRTIDLFNELAEHGIHDTEIATWELDPPQAMRAITVRKIAEHLFLIAARMDIQAASKGS